jgi:HSP20 family protein
MTLVKRNGGLGTRNQYPSNFFQDDFFNSELPLFAWAKDYGFNSALIPAANIKEDEKEFLIELSVPGYSKKEIHLEVDNNLLQITGKREDETMDETENYTRREFSSGSFSRSFQLPESIKEDEITAKCNDGVLSVVLPKKELTSLTSKTNEIAIS